MLEAADSMPDNWIHLCIDMQRMFAEQTPWHVPWMATASPQIVELSGRYAERTVFTRFVPPPNADAMPGMWRNYYEKWPMMTGEQLPSELMDTVADLRPFAPPARFFDKRTYSPWIDGRLHETLAREKVEAIAITGGETDICVLAAALGAIDLGYRVILLKDAVCSSADETHDATLELLGGRFSVQVEITDTDAFLSGL
jgi:nicotinamidase-related amidase